MKAWLNTIYLIGLFMMGFLAGTIFGTYIIVQNVIQTTANLFHDANVNINLNFNETELVNELNKSIVPELREIKGEVRG